VLAFAIRSRKSITDISHILSHPSTQLDDVSDLLYHTLSILEVTNDGMSDMWTRDLLGVAVEIYRYRHHYVFMHTIDSLGRIKVLHQGRSNSETEILTARWQTAHEMCSLVACNMAFEDCQEGDAYDLGEKSTTPDELLFLNFFWKTQKQYGNLWHCPVGLSIFLKS